MIARVRKPTSPSTSQPFVVLSCLVATALAGSAFAPRLQIETLRIRGQVVAEGGGPVAGATIRTDATRGVMAQQFTGQREFTTRTGKNGDWSLLGVTRGLWIFEVSAPDYLPHVVVVPISMMLKPDLLPWETSFALQPVATIAPPDAPSNAPGRLVAEAADQIVTGNRNGAHQTLQRIALEPNLDAAGLCAAGDIALLLRDSLMARKFFELAATANEKWYRPQLGIASAAMLNFDLDRAVKAYAATRTNSTNKRLQQTMSSAIRELQQIQTIPR